MCDIKTSEEVTTFTDYGASSVTCKCNCPEACDHVWTGPTVATYYGMSLGPIEDHVDTETKRIKPGSLMQGGSVTCSHCGMTAEQHDIRLG